MTQTQTVALYLAVLGISMVFASLAQVFPAKVWAHDEYGLRGLAFRPNRLFFMLSFSVMVLLAGARYEVGTDYGTYEEMFDLASGETDVHDLSEQYESTEPGYKLLNSTVFKLFGHNAPALFTACSLLTMFFFGLGAREYQEKISVALFVMVFFTQFYMQTFNIQRQYIAMGITFYAARYMYSRRFFPFIIWMLIAMSFHTSVLLFIPFYFIVTDSPNAANVRRITYIALFLLSVGFFAILPVLMSLPIIGDYLNSMSQLYQPGFKLGGILLQLPLLLPVIVFRERIFALDRRNRMWFTLMICEIFFTYLGNFNAVMSRLATYFSMSWLVLVPAAVRSMPTKNLQRIMGFVICIACLGLWYYYYVYKGYADVVPYRFFFTQNR